MSSYSPRLCYRLARTSFSNRLLLPHLIFLLKTCIILLLLQLRRLRQLQRLQTLRHTHKCNTKCISNSKSNNNDISISNNTIITAPSTTSSRLTLHRPLHLHLRHLHLRLQHLHHLLCQTWHLQLEQIKDSLGCSSSSSSNNSNISTTYRHLREERAISRRNLQQSRHRSLRDVCNGAINNLIVILCR